VNQPKMNRVEVNIVCTDDFTRTRMSELIQGSLRAMGFQVGAVQGLTPSFGPPQSLVLSQFTQNTVVGIAVSAPTTETPPQEPKPVAAPEPEPEQK